jgi:hypothetical protein
MRSIKIKSCDINKKKDVKKKEDIISIILKISVTISPKIFQSELIK